MDSNGYAIIKDGNPIFAIDKKGIYIEGRQASIIFPPLDFEISTVDTDGNVNFLASGSVLESDQDPQAENDSPRYDREFP